MMAWALVKTSVDSINVEEMKLHKIRPAAKKEAIRPLEL